MTIRVLRNASLAAIALSIAIAGVPAKAQVGSADKCVKVHTSKCPTATPRNDYQSRMGLHVQNICEKEILLFLRTDYFTAPSAAWAKRFPKGQRGTPWKHNSAVSNFVPHKTPPKSYFSGMIPCWKKVKWAYCAEYMPDNFRELTGDYNPDKYMKMAPEFRCYREIIKDPFQTREGDRFHPLTDFVVDIKDRSTLNKSTIKWIDRIYSDRFKGKAAVTNHISKLPKPVAAN